MIESITSIIDIYRRWFSLWRN